MATSSRLVQAILGVLGFIAITTILAIIIYFVEKNLIKTNATRQAVHFWFQIFTGNWSSPDFYLQKKIKYIQVSISLALALMLNILTFGLVGLTINYFLGLRKGRFKMKLSTAFAIRDISVKQNFESLLREKKLFSEEQIIAIKNALEKGFDQGDNLWKDKIIDTLESSGVIADANKFRSAMKSGILSGSPLMFEIPSP